MNENKEIKEAMNELEEMSKDEELRRVAELREKAIRDEANIREHAREEGIIEGKIKGKIEVAKMKVKNMDIDTIIEITGLKEEDIEKL